MSDSRMNVGTPFPDAIFSNEALMTSRSTVEAMEKKMEKKSEELMVKQMVLSQKNDSGAMVEKMEKLHVDSGKTVEKMVGGKKIGEKMKEMGELRLHVGTVPTLDIGFGNEKSGLDVRKNGGKKIPIRDRQANVKLASVNFENQNLMVGSHGVSIKSPKKGSLSLMRQKMTAGDKFISEKKRIQKPLAPAIDPLKNGLLLDGFLMLQHSGMEFPEQVRTVSVSSSHLFLVLSEDMIHFTHLTRADFSDNNIYLPSLSVFPKLERLCLSCNGVSDFNISGGFNCLQVLDLSCNGLSIHAISQLSQCLELRELDLSSNELSSLPSPIEFSLFRKLEKLSLKRNRLQSSLLFLTLAAIPVLKELDVSQNLFEEVASELSVWSELEFTHEDEPPCETIPKVAFTELCVLNLSYNYFSHEEAIIPLSICRKLNVLDLRFNLFITSNGISPQNFPLLQSYLIETLGVTIVLEEPLEMIEPTKVPNFINDISESLESEILDEDLITGDQSDDSPENYFDNDLDTADVSAARNSLRLMLKRPVIYDQSLKEKSFMQTTKAMQSRKVPSKLHNNLLQEISEKKSTQNSLKQASVLRAKKLLAALQGHTDIVEVSSNYLKSSETRDKIVQQLLDSENSLTQDYS